MNVFRRFLLFSLNFQCLIECFKLFSNVFGQNLNVFFFGISNVFIQIYSKFQSFFNLLCKKWMFLCFSTENLNVLQCFSWFFLIFLKFLIVYRMFLIVFQCFWLKFDCFANNFTVLVYFFQNLIKISMYFELLCKKFNVFQCFWLFFVIFLIFFRNFHCFMNVFPMFSWQKSKNIDKNHPLV